MFQRLIEKLVGPKDPTADWSKLAQSTPEVDSAQRTVGGLRFGEGWAEARRFGRPDRFSWINPGYGKLVYAQAGWQMDFDQGRFAYAAFFTGPDRYLPAISPSISFSRPRLDRVELSCETTQSQVEQMFGPPGLRDRDDEETILFYTGGELTLEFEFGPGGNLKRFNIYPT